MFYTRLAQHPGGEGVAVRPRPIAVLVAEGVFRDAVQHCLDGSRLAASPFGRNAGCAAADIRIRMLQVAVHVADAAASRIARLPDFPAMAGAVFPDDEPVMRGEQA